MFHVAVFIRFVFVLYVFPKYLSRRPINTNSLKNVQENCIYTIHEKKKLEYSRLHPIYLHMLWPIKINDTQAHVKVIIVHNSRIPHFVLLFKVLKFRE